MTFWRDVGGGGEEWSDRSQLESGYIQSPHISCAKKKKTCRHTHTAYAMHIHTLIHKRNIMSFMAIRIHTVHTNNNLSHWVTNSQPDGLAHMSLGKTHRWRELHQPMWNTQLDLWMACDICQCMVCSTVCHAQSWPLLIHILSCWFIYLSGHLFFVCVCVRARVHACAGLVSIYVFHQFSLSLELYACEFHHCQNVNCWENIRVSVCIWGLNLGQSVLLFCTDSLNLYGITQSSVRLMCVSGSVCVWFGVW